MQCSGTLQDRMAHAMFVLLARSRARPHDVRAVRRGRDAYVSQQALCALDASLEVSRLQIKRHAPFLRVSDGPSGIVRTVACIRCAQARSRTHSALAALLAGQYWIDGRECVDCEPGYEPSSVSRQGCTSCSDRYHAHPEYRPSVRCMCWQAGKQPNEDRHECIECGSGEYSDGSLANHTLLIAAEG